MPDLFVNGKPIGVPGRTTVAAAIYIAGIDRFRISVSGETRAPLCGMGICMECRVTINGRPQQRSCQILAESGMTVETA